MTVDIRIGDCRELLRDVQPESIHAIVTDPPYHLTSIVKRFGETAQTDNTKTSERARNGADGYARLSTGFMGQKWDGGDVTFRPETWRLCFDVLKPGGYLLAFGGTRTYHRMACAVEDAGFEIRDQIAWVFGSGFPKSHDVIKAIDRAAGVEFSSEPASGVGFMGPDGPGGHNPTKNKLTRRGTTTEAAKQWEGWGTALKPAHEPILWAQKPLIRPCLEPIVVARKPFKGTVAANVQEHGTAALNIDGCRIHSDDAKGGEYTVKRLKPGATLNKTGGNWRPQDGSEYQGQLAPGRWPANVIHDGSEEVLAEFDRAGVRTSGRLEPHHAPDRKKNSNVYGKYSGLQTAAKPFGGDTGSAARFFYCPKADKSDRLGSRHPTVKPVDLIAYLVRLVTPPGGMVLDPFAGSGTTAMACLREGFDCIVIERDPDYAEDIRRRIAHVEGSDTPLFDDGSAPARPAQEGLL